MPWIKNKDGSKEYKLSIYTKEELPTWDEIYNEWYKGKQFIYDPNDEKCKVEDPYWKIPHSYYLLLVVCNQLNKMIHEDGMKDGLLRALQGDSSFNCSTGSSLVEYVDFTDIRFVLSIGSPNDVQDIIDGQDIIKEVQHKYLRDRWRLGTDEPPMIYSLKLPLTGEKNPFIIDEDRRIFISGNNISGNNNELTSISAFIDCECHFDNPTTGPILKYSPLLDENPDKYFKIIDYLMEPYKNYFENGIGWKDKNGQPVNNTKGYHLGYDPAK